MRLYWHITNFLLATNELHNMGMSDMVLARNIGAKGILVLTGVGKGSLDEYRHTWQDTEPYFVADNLLAAAGYIIKNNAL